MTQMEYIPLKTADGTLIGHARVRDGVVRFSFKGASKGRAVVLTKSGGVPGDLNGGAVVTSRVLAAAVVEDGRMTASGFARGADLKSEELKRRVENFFGGAARQNQQRDRVRDQEAPPRQSETESKRDRELNQSAGVRIAPADAAVKSTRETEIKKQAGLTEAGEASAERIKAQAMEKAEEENRARQEVSLSAGKEKTRTEELNNMAAVEGISAPEGTGALKRQQELDLTAGLKPAPQPTTLRHTARVEDTALFRDLEKEAEQAELKARPGGDEESLPIKAAAKEQKEAAEVFGKGGLEKDSISNAAESISKRQDTEPARRKVPAGLNPLLSAEAGAAPLQKKTPLKDTDSEAFYSLLNHSEAVYRSILEPAAPRREAKDPLPFSRSGSAPRADWHEEVDALLKNAAPEQRIVVPNPFPHIFPNAAFIKLVREGRMERLEGDWRRGSERFLILAVPGGYSPMPPPELKGFTRYIRSRAGGFWVKVIEKSAR